MNVDFQPQSIHSLGNPLEASSGAVAVDPSTTPEFEQKFEDGLLQMAQENMQRNFESFKESLEDI